MSTEYDDATPTRRQRRQRQPEPAEPPPPYGGKPEDVGESRREQRRLARRPDDLGSYRPGPNDPDARTIRTVFSKFDSDGSGSIDRDELSMMLKVFGTGAGDRTVNAYLHKFDTDGSGNLSVGEFANLLKELRPASVATVGKEWREQQGSAVLVKGTVIKPSDASAVASKPSAWLDTCGHWLALFMGLGPAMGCLCLYYSLARGAPCSEKIGEWLVVQGGVGVGICAVMLVRLCASLSRRGRRLPMPDSDHEPDDGDGCLFIVMLVVFGFQFVWWLTGNVRVYKTGPCDEDHQDIMCEVWHTTWPSRPTCRLSSRDHGGSYSYQRWCRVETNPTCLQQYDLNETSFEEVLDSAYSTDGGFCCDEDLWNGAHYLIIFTYVAFAVSICGSICCAACLTADEADGRQKREERAMLRPSSGARQGV